MTPVVLDISLWFKNKEKIYI